MEPTLVRDAGHILISNDGGSAWSTVSSLVHSSNGSSFDHHKINLGDFIGQTINVRFYFDTLDEEVNLFEGWYIDDVKVVCQATSLNNDPTDINLSSSSIDENQPANTLVGTFSTVDQDASDSHTYTLVAGVGDSDNASFQVASNQLQSSAIFDFESKSTYNIRVRTDDGQGGIFEKTFTIAINDVPEVDLSLTKTVDNPNPDEGDNVTFVITLINGSSSTTATNIQVTDILPAGITPVADSATQGNYDETTGIWSVGTLGTSTSTVLTITASIDSGTGGTSITNTAEVTAVDQGDNDSTPDNGVEAEDDQDSATISVKPVDLSLTKTVDNSTPNVGNIVTFTITLTNNSISTPASNIQVTDQLPAGITHVADSATQGDYDETLGIWSIGTLGASTSTILTITASINSGAGGTSITNTAEITAVDQGDNDSTPNNGIATEDDQDSANINVTAPPSSSSSSSSGGGGGGGGSSARPVIAFDPEAFIFRSEENGGNPDPQTLRIWTSKSRSVLRFTVSEDAPWLTVGADEGISSDPGDKERIEISVKTSGLDAGSHEGMITISAGRANNDPQIIPVTLIIEEQLPPGVLSSFKSVVNKESDSEFVTRNEEILLNIPRNSIHNDLEDVEVEINVLDVDSLPIPSGNTIIVRAVELNTFIDGQVSPIDFEEPVELVFSLTDEDLALVDGDVSRFGVSLYRPETNEWEPLLVRHVSDPLPNGRLLVALNHFSIYALGVLEKRTDPELVSSPTPTPTIVPAAELVRTAVPTQVLEQAPRVVLTEIPQSPSFGRVTVVPTSAPSVLPTSTPAAKGSVAATPASEPPTATPTKMPAPVVAAVLLPTATVLAGLEDKVIVEVGEEGGFSMTTIAIMVLAGIAVAAGGFGVVQAMLSRDKPRQILRRTESGGFGVVQAMLSRDKLRQILRRGVVRAVLSRDKLRQILRRTESD